jgi:hypothetical protein
MVDKDKEGKEHVVLIDFGFAVKYVTDDGHHISNEGFKDTF